jgi:hypothetical protein
MESSVTVLWIYNLNNCALVREIKKHIKSTIQIKAGEG